MSKMHMVIYVENCSHTHKIFSSKKEMNKFIKTFMENRPNIRDYWIDYIITNIKGEIKTPGLVD